MPSPIPGVRRVSSDLVERAQRGDHEAFDAIATAAYHRLYAVSRRILRDGYAAEDVVQETLIRAWRDLPGLRAPGRFDAWLHRLLIRACQDHVRAQRRRPPQVLVLDIDRRVGTDAIARLADRDQLERAFLELSVDHRAVLVLTHYVGLRAPEIAAILDIRPGTVYSRLHYAVLAMRAALIRSELSEDASTRTTTPKPEHGR
jgi:RNA polymerase sigma-70 factor, ECF subfamily